MLRLLSICSFVGLLARFAAASGCDNAAEFDFVRATFFELNQKAALR